MRYLLRAMAARTPLAQFVFDRIMERGETPEEFATRIGINASGLYKFLRGAYIEPRQATLDKIAAGLSMTLVDLLVPIGKGDQNASAEETEILALYREVAHEDRRAVHSMLRGLRRRETKQDGDFGRPKITYSYQAVPRQSRSLISQRLAYGLEPM